jgi:hypothetical protein
LHFSPLQDDLSLKEDHLIDIITNKPLPRGFYVSGSPTVVPGLPNKLAFGESRVINYRLINWSTPTTAININIVVIHVVIEFSVYNMVDAPKINYIIVL